MTATLTTLTAVETNGDVVKNIEAPMYAGLIAMSADLQYATIENPTAWAGVQPNSYVAPCLLTGIGRKDCVYWPRPRPVTPTSKYTLKAYQDAGANQEVDAILSHVYGRGTSRPLSEVIGIPSNRRTSKGANLTADTWTEINKISDLQTDKSYALIGAMAYGSDARAVRFKHDDFFGLTPVLPAFSDVSQGVARFPLCPVFRGSMDLTVEGYAGAAQDMNVILELIQL